MKRFEIITGLLSGFLFGAATPFSKLLLAGLNSFQVAGLLTFDSMPKQITIRIPECGATFGII